MILYIIRNKNFSIEDSINELEKLIESYTSTATDARKLIQKAFKDHVNASLNIV